MSGGRLWNRASGGRASPVGQGVGRHASAGPTSGQMCPAGRGGRGCVCGAVLTVDCEAILGVDDEYGGETIGWGLGAGCRC